MKKRLLLLVFLPLLTFGQNYEDALRYSIYQPYGTARFNSMGGAFTALGGDLSAGVLNPASNAVYNHDELSFGLGFLSNYTEGQIIKDYRSNDVNVVLTNFGIVGKINDSEENANERNWGISVALNRTADFNQNLESELVYNESSLINWYLEGAQGQTYDQLNPFSDYLAWDSFLIDTLNGETNYVGAISGPGQSIYQKTTRSGGITDLGIQAAKRQNNKFMFGFGLHIPILRYREEVVHRESSFSDTSSLLQNFEYQTNLKANGAGINVKAGLIYRPVEWFRLGLAVHSPTWYTITEEYTSSVKANYKGDVRFESNSPFGDFEYQLRTPARFIIGGAFVLGPHALLSVDYEWMDYSFSRLSTENDYSYDVQNNQIKSTLQANTALRLGFEWRIAHWSLRAGYGFMGSPWASDGNWDHQNFALGLAYRAEDYFLEASFNRTLFTEDVSLYELEDGLSPNGVVELNKQYVSVTVGKKF